MTISMLSSTTILEGTRLLGRHGGIVEEAIAAVGWPWSRPGVALDRYIIEEAS